VLSFDLATPEHQLLLPNSHRASNSRSLAPSWPGTVLEVAPQTYPLALCMSQ